MRHEFQLLHDPIAYFITSEADGFDHPRYDAVKAAPPNGCVPEDFAPFFGLRCVRDAEDRLTAVAEVVAEVRARHGLLLTDLGIEKLGEWSPDDPAFTGDLIAQLLLMALDRAHATGIRVEALTGFLHAVRDPAQGARRDP